MNVLKFLLITSIVSAAHVFSQNTALKWYFGMKAGLNFSSTPPTALTNGSMNISEGCASVSDNNGGLLFYTNGVTVWNSQHAVMANGTGLMGDPSSTQSALIVKQPGNANIYYIFTNGAGAALPPPPGFRYSVVNMSLAAGLGSVTTSNVQLFTPSSEKVTAVKHANNTDVWIVTHEWATNKFRSYLLTSAGLNTSAVITPVGSVHNGTPLWSGYMKASPNGKKLGIAMSTNASTNTPGSSVEVYDFDRATGIVSNFLSLSTMNGAYGCEFSPDGTKFYASQWFGNGTILQWNLCAGSNTAIIASQYSVDVSPVTEAALQLGPDGKIYVSVPSHTSVDVINSPNQAGAACNYVTQAVSLAPKTCQYGLPNFPHYSLGAMSQITYTVNPLNCNIVSFSSLVSSTIVKWFFGDPASGASNSSTSSQPSHQYPGPGIYNAQLITNSCYSQDTLFFEVNTTIPSGQINVSPSNTICAGESVTLSIPVAGSYTWSSNHNGSPIVVLPATTTPFSVTGIANTGCPISASITINVNPSPTVSITSPGFVCAGQSVILTANGATSYTWSNNQTSPAILVSPSMTSVYVLTGNSGGICSPSVSVTLSVIPMPTVAVTGTNAICSGQSTTLTADGANTYVWSNGVTGQSVVATPNSTTLFTVTGSNGGVCASAASIIVSVNVLPSVAISGPESVCPGESFTLSASGADSYLWSNNLTGASITPVSATGTNTFSVTGTNSLTSCAGQQTISVSVDLCTGLATHNKDHLHIYPNPVHDNLFVKSELPGQLSVYNALGMLKLKTGVHETETVIDLEELPAGIYILRFQAESRVTDMKLIKAD